MAKSNQISIYLNQSNQENLERFMQLIRDNPLLMDGLSVKTKSSVINLVLEVFLPMMMNNFRNNRTWTMAVNKLAQVSDNQHSSEEKALARYAKKIDEVTKTSDKSYYILLDLLQHIIRNNPEDWRDLHSILDASSKEHEIDQHLHELISKDIGQRNRMKK